MTVEARSEIETGLPVLPPGWLRSDVPLTLLLDLACLKHVGYPEMLGEALAREASPTTPLTD
jgi:hypothetical protein